MAVIHFRWLGIVYFEEGAFCPTEDYELKLYPINLKVEPVYKNVSI
jgi:hypothetical protein